MRFSQFCVAPTAMAFLGLSGLSRAAYTLKDNYTPSNFFSMFNFYTVCMSCRLCETG